MNDSLLIVANFLAAIIVYNIPLLYGTCGEILTEKSGSLNLGVEGTMAIGAIFGYIAACSTDSLFVGVLVAFLVASLIGAFFAFMTVSLQANQNVTGLTITTFGIAMYYFVGNGLTNSGKWPNFTDNPNLVKATNELDLGPLSDIPFIGKIFFSQSFLVYFGIALAILMYVYLSKTKFGMRVRAIGENPAAADSLGINVNLNKYIHIMVGSGIMGVGGLYMAFNMSGSFEGSNCWINGYGWIAIALVIFANWNPAKAILGTFVFGFFNTLRNYNGSLATAFPTVLGFLGKIPSHFFSALPFIITLLVLIFDSVRKNKHSNEPAAIGINYYREDR